MEGRTVYTLFAVVLASGLVFSQDKPVAKKHYELKSGSYRIHVTSPEQEEQVKLRIRLWQLLVQTFEDEQNGIYDAKKYAEMKHIAAHLHGRKEVGCSALTATAP